MALTQKSSILYGLEVTTLNSSLDFVAVNSGPTIMATIALGYYSLTDLVNAVASAMNMADINNKYTATVNRAINNGTQNRVTISTNGAYLEILFGTGPRVASSIAPLIGFSSTDQTGATTYTGTGTCGTLLIPTWYGYQYLDFNQKKKIFGNVNISAIGQKEAIVFQVQQFFQVQFKYEPLAYVNSNWAPFFDWAIQQKAFDWTPDITQGNTAYNVTLEDTAADGQGLAHDWAEMLPEFPQLFDSDILTLRLKVG